MENISRRDFLHFTSLTAMGLLTGCATNPVTGHSQLMLVSQDQEIALDRQNSPYQLSSDYGTCQDYQLSEYLQRTGRKIAATTHRLDLPYSFKCVNASYINAYAFPGGTIAATRGILLTLESEAELAALFGHELGHVNARHTAEQMTKGSLVSAFVSGISLYAGTKGEVFGQTASLLGGIGTGALLASYSRDNERQADSLAMEYMVKAGHNPGGLVRLMTMLNSKSSHNPGALELMFATHPMNKERLASANLNLQRQPAHVLSLPFNRERYMDNTANLRTKKEMIEEIQKGEEALAKKDLPSAEGHLQKALKKDPRDYAALTIMAKCQLMAQKPKEAAQYAKQAKEIYPQEAQAHLIGGLSLIHMKQFQAALTDLNTYDRSLPGNPNLLFFKGLSYEGMQQRDEAARNYHAYLQKVTQGEQSQYAYKRLVEWKYLNPAAPAVK